MIYAIKCFGCVQITYKNWAGVLLIVFYSLPEGVDAHIGSMFLLKPKWLSDVFKKHSVLLSIKSSITFDIDVATAMGR